MGSEREGVDFRNRIARAIEEGETKGHGGWLDNFHVGRAEDAVVRVVEEMLRARDSRLAFYRERWTDAERRFAMAEAIVGRHEIEPRALAEFTVAKRIRNWEDEQAKEREARE